jgi:hypothetical protein
MFRANKTHPLFKEIRNIVLKTIGIDSIIENVVERLGEVEKVYLVGEFSKGLDSEVIDLVLIGNIDKSFLIKLVDKSEKLINRKIRYLVYPQAEFNSDKFLNKKPEPLLLWLKD